MKKKLESLKEFAVLKNELLTKVSGGLLEAESTTKTQNSQTREGECTDTYTAVTDDNGKVLTDSCCKTCP